LFVSTLCWAQSCPIYSNSEQLIRLNPAVSCFILRLPSNPTTGYSWQLHSYPKQLIKLVKHHYLPPTEPIPGRGGYEQWVFNVAPVALQPTPTANIKFSYRRPWEKHIQPAKQVIFSIVL
jgi:inhibitor of cysteine peptidase